MYSFQTWLNNIGHGLAVTHYSFGYSTHTINTSLVHTGWCAWELAWHVWIDVVSVNVLGCSGIIHFVWGSLSTTGRFSIYPCSSAVRPLFSRVSRALMSMLQMFAFAVPASTVAGNLSAYFLIRIRIFWGHDLLRHAYVAAQRFSDSPPWEKWNAECSRCLSSPQRCLLSEVRPLETCNPINIFL